MQVRRKLVGNTEPSYSQYTCYTGIADFTPPDIDTVGYRVFLGNGKYFVSSDVGGGKMQWCAAGSKHAHRSASVAPMASVALQPAGVKLDGCATKTVHTRVEGRRKFICWSQTSRDM